MVKLLKVLKQYEPKSVHVARCVGVVWVKLIMDY